MEYYVPNSAVKYDNNQNEGKDLYRNWAAVLDLTSEGGKKYVGYHSETYYWEGSGWEDNHIGLTFWSEMPSDFLTNNRKVKEEECSNASEAIFYKFKEDMSKITKKDKIKEEEIKFTFEEFWDRLSHDKWCKDDFYEYMKENIKNKYTQNEWFDFFLEYKKADRHIDASTELDVSSLIKFYPIAVYYDYEGLTGNKKYFTIEPKQNYVIMNNWFFVRRFKNYAFARDFVLSENAKQIKSPASITLDILSGVLDKMKKENVEHITTDIKEVMKWLIDDKQVMYRVVHPGVSASEADDWKKLDSENPKLGTEFEYVLAEEISDTFNISITPFKVTATCKEDAIDAALEILKSHKDYISVK